jgi:hypothetical protein
MNANQVPSLHPDAAAGGGDKYDDTKAAASMIHAAARSTST